MFDKLITEFVVPASEMETQDYFIGFCNLAIDAVNEIYHKLKISGDQDVVKSIRVRQALLKN
jgi:hypothetical protein